MLDNATPSWPPEGYTVIGNYAFEPPTVPTELELEQAEQFVFTEPSFEGLDEGQRRRNVMRLAIAAATSETVGIEEDSSHIKYIPLIGTGVQMNSRLHEGTIVHTYSILKED